MNEYFSQMNEAIAREIEAIAEFQEAKKAFEKALAKLTIAASDARHKIERYRKQGEP